MNITGFHGFLFQSVVPSVIFAQNGKISIPHTAYQIQCPKSFGKAFRNCDAVNLFITINFFFKNKQFNRRRTIELFVF